MARVNVGKEPTPVQAVLMEKRKRAKGGDKEGFYCDVTLAGMGWNMQFNCSEDVFATLPPEGEKCVAQLRLSPTRAGVTRGGKTFQVDLLEPEIVSCVVAGNRG